MISNKHFFIVFFLIQGVLACPLFAQDTQQPERSTQPAYKYRLSTPIITVPNLFEPLSKRTNTQHIELHFKYQADDKNILGVKFATWRLFQPMGILWWDGLLEKIDSQSEFYPGYLRETGLGISYQRMVWKGLFVTVEALPQVKTYLDERGFKMANGFKLYTSYHVGYHIPLLKRRIFIEPQVHCQNWMIDTHTPFVFREMDTKWRKYFLFEPNMYVGVNF